MRGTFDKCRPPVVVILQDLPKEGRCEAAHGKFSRRKAAVQQFLAASVGKFAMEERLRGYFEGTWGHLGGTWPAFGAPLESISNKFGGDGVFEMQIGLESADLENTS